jgi:predicted nucleic acid-binding protein
VARVALDADIVIAFLDAGDDQHERAVSELRPLLAAGDKLLVDATLLTLDKELQQVAKRAQHRS